MRPLTIENVAKLAADLAELGDVRVKNTEEWIDPSLRGVPTVSCELGRDRYGRSRYVSYSVGDLAPETREEAAECVRARLADHVASERKIAANLRSERDNK